MDPIKQNNHSDKSDNKNVQNGLHKSWKLIENIIIYVAIVSISLPIFIIIHRNIPNLNWNYHLDRIILYVLILLVLLIIVKFVRRLFVILCVGLLLFLIIETYRGGYGLIQLAEDYNAMILSMSESNKPQKILIDKVVFNSSDVMMVKAMDYTNPEVRTFALKAVNKYFKEYQNDNRYRTTIQCLAIFKEINSRWSYVNDPVGQEYYAKASESIKTLSGDCDDHSILMASCIRAIGGIPRLVYTVGHIYPELYIGDESDLESINFLIKHKLFDKESKGRSLYYHIDQDGKIWLNLDYTAHYPGGPFYNNKVLGVIDIEN